MKIRIISSHSFVRSQHEASSKRPWLLTAVFMLVTVIGKLTAQPLTSSQTTVQPASVENREEDKPKIDPDTLDKYFFIGHFGGNINFVDRNLSVNSIYTDVQFSPRLKLTDRLGISLPIRIYYNNGSGPQQSGPDSQTALTASGTNQRIITVDTVTLAPKIRYWDDKFILINKSEQRNLGLNIPILGTFSLGDNNPCWNITAGINLDFTWVTNRSYDYQYSPVTADTARFYVVNNRSQIPVGLPTVVNSVTTSSPLFYGVTPFRPEAPVSRSYDYAQIFAGFQVGLEHYSKAYNFSLRYSIGGISSYATRQYNSINTYNQVFQLIFLEKKLGIQFLGEIRTSSSNQETSRTNLTTSIPYYYFSLSKTIYLSRIKEIFFP